MDKSFSQIEREYWTTKAGGATPTEPLTSVMRRYLQPLVSGTNMDSLDILLKKWLIKICTDNSKPISNSRSIETLWRDAANAVSGGSSTYITENKFRIYKNT